MSTIKQIIINTENTQKTDVGGGKQFTKSWGIYRWMSESCTQVREVTMEVIKQKA